MPRRSSRPSVVYWNNYAQPYMVERFNAVADRGQLDFEAWFSHRHYPMLDIPVDEPTWRFPYRFLPEVQFAGQTMAMPAASIAPGKDLIVSLYSDPEFVLGWLLDQVHRRTRTAFWCVATHDWIVGRRPWKETIKRWMFSHVDATLSPGTDGRTYAMRYGVPEHRALILHHAIDVVRYRQQRDVLLPQRAGLRERLGTGSITYLYVGRLSREKGLESLIEAFALLNSSDAPPANLLIVGSGPMHATLVDLAQARGVENVLFVGAKRPDELPEYYVAADVCVFPTLGDTYGMVIDEAMAFSLPVISTTAVGEIADRIQDGITGYLVKPGDSRALAEAMSRLRRDAESRRKMGDAAARRVAMRSLDNWAVEFETAADTILSMPRV